MMQDITPRPRRPRPRVWPHPPPVAPAVLSTRTVLVRSRLHGLSSRLSQWLLPASRSSCHSSTRSYHTPVHIRRGTDPSSLTFKFFLSGAFGHLRLDIYFI